MTALSGIRSAQTFFACVALMLMTESATASVFFYYNLPGYSESRGISVSASVATPTASRRSDFSNLSSGDYLPFIDALDAAFTLPGASASATASQTSVLTLTTAHAEGTANASASATDSSLFPWGLPTSASANAQSRLSLSFLLMGPETFRLHGSVSGVGGVFGFPGPASVQLSNEDGSFQMMFSSPTSGGTTPFDISGTLFPGIYTLSAEAHSSTSAPWFSNSGGLSSFILDASIGAAAAPIPVPAAAWLLGAGLLGLIGSGARRRRVV